VTRAGVAALLFLGGCGCEHGVTADAFPISVRISGGAVLAEIQEGDGPPRPAVLDLFAPFTVLDVAADAPVSRRCADLTLLDTGDVPRAHLHLTASVFNACGDADTCQVGDDTTTEPIDAIIGGDAFAPGAARFDFVAGELTLFPDIAGDGAARGRLCEAQIPDPFRGGGTLNIGGAYVDFSARRIAIGACLSFDPSEDPEVITDAGADVQLVLSTAIGPTILSQDAFDRYRAASNDPAPPVATATVWMPSGPITGQPATINRLSLVGYSDDQRGPCRQTYAHHLLTDRNCLDTDDCPCPDGQICRVPSITELEPATPIPVLVVPDDDPTLQALRDELRPNTAEVDGILGTTALAATSIDVDPPNNRVLIRCESSAGCEVRPELITVELRELIDTCAPESPTP
jgi:hypothetical protein